MDFHQEYGSRIREGKAAAAVQRLLQDEQQLQATDNPEMVKSFSKAAQGQTPEEQQALQTATMFWTHDVARGVLTIPTRVVADVDDTIGLGVALADKALTRAVGAVAGAEPSPEKPGKPGGVLPSGVRSGVDAANQWAAPQTGGGALAQRLADFVATYALIPGGALAKAVLSNAGLRAQAAKAAVEAGKAGIAEFIQSGNEEAAAEDLRMVLVDLASSDPAARESLREFLTAQDADVDRLIEKSVAASVAAGLTWAQMMLPQAMRSLRKVVGGRLRGEDADILMGSPAGMVTLPDGTVVRKTTEAMRDAAGVAGGAPVAGTARESLTASASVGTVRLYSGSGGAEAGGAGGSWWTTNQQRAASFGPNVKVVDVPADVYRAAQEEARRQGSGTAGDAVLSGEWVNRSRPAAGIKQAVYDLGAAAARLGQEPQAMLKNGWLRAERFGTDKLHVEVNIDDPVAVERAKRLFEAQGGVRQFVVDASSADKMKSDFFYASSPDEATRNLQTLAEGGTIRRSAIRAFREDPEMAQEALRSGGVPSYLDQLASEARARFKSKLNRPGMTAGMVDPESLRDMGVIGAALLARGVKEKSAWRSAMVEALGEGVSGRIEKAWDKSVRTYEQTIRRLVPDIEEKVVGLKRYFEAGKDTYDWYHKVRESLTALGDERDQKIFVGFIAAHSPLTEPNVNVDLALNSFIKWKQGLPWDEVVGKPHIAKQAVIGNMKRVIEAADGKVDISKVDVFNAMKDPARKINAFYRNLWHSIERADDVTVDTWMFRLFGFSDRAINNQVGHAQYDTIRDVLRQEATKYGMQPSELQAALWIGARRLEEAKARQITLSELRLLEQVGESAVDSRPIRAMIKDKLDAAIQRGDLVRDERGLLRPAKGYTEPSKKAKDMNLGALLPGGAKRRPAAEWD